jgi:hypothetical protein
MNNPSEWVKQRVFHAPLLTCPITGTLQNGDTP